MTPEQTRRILYLHALGFTDRVIADTVKVSEADVRYTINSKLNSF